MKELELKSYDTFLLGVHAALSRDVAAYYPEGATEWRRDQTRLRSLLNTRGLRYLTIDLVAAGKHFDQCLQAGLYTPSLIAGMAVEKGRAIPRLFGGLLGKVFGRHSGKLRIDVDLQAISLLRQTYYLAKKIRMTCRDKETFSTVSEYFDIERSIRSSSLDWECDRIDRTDIHRLHLGDAGPVRSGTEDGRQLSLALSVESATKTADDTIARVRAIPGLLDTIQRVADLMSTEIGDFDYADLLPKHGPGAVADRGRESKFDFPYWPAKLNNSFPAEYFAYYNEASVWTDQDDGAPTLSKGEPPSRLIAVPKTQKAPRLIASEPTAHQWIQQSILRFLTRRMDDMWLSHCVSIRDQRPSRHLALLASTHCHLSTIDLSSASDRVSCWLVERIFRRNGRLIDAFHACRTRWLVNDIDKKQPRHTMLRKFSTMGSALTFPVQSIIYAVVCVGVDIWMENSLVREGVRQPRSDLTRLSALEFRKQLVCSSKRVRVFGDDLIHPVESTALLIEVLTYLGLKVNTSKTFAAGFFRESCGLDAYQGIDVTPCYVNEVPCDTEPESLISVVESSNNCHERGLWWLADYLVNALPGWFRNNLAVKAVGSGAFGLSSFVGADLTHLKKRWNEQLHHEEVRVLTALPKGRKRRGIRGSAALLQYFTEAPPPTIKWANGVGLRTPLTLKRMGVPTYYYQKK
jgi:hypothetical protein